MSSQITTAMVEQYRSNLQTLMQQKQSRLRLSVRQESIEGKNAFFEQLNSTNAYEITNRHADTILIDTPHLRRRVSTRDIGWADMIDAADKNKILIDPASAYLENAQYALNRKIDDYIVAAFLATAYGGVDGSTSYSFPGGKQIAHGSAGMTIAKLRSAKQLLDKDEVDENDRYVACTAEQINNLLATTEVTSSDYNTVRALVNGDPGTLLGFKFIRLERLTKASTTRSCVAWQKNSMLLAVGQDIITSIDKRPDKNNGTQVLARMTIGATRMDEKGVVEIQCTETA